MPISGARMDIQGKEDVLSELSRSGADRVVLVTDSHYFAENAYRKEIDMLRDNIEFMRQNGYEPLVWLGSTIGHGGVLAHLAGECPNGQDFTRFTTIDGETFEDSFCPMDQSFALRICQWIQDLVKIGVRELLLDDDFRLSCRGLGVFGCCCPLHMAEYQKRLGEPITREQIREKVFTGFPGKHRKIWRDMTGETLESFARKIRSAVDEIDKTVRVGICTSPAGWDWDGTDVLTLSKLLAGNTRPLLRLTSAPYWAKLTDNRLGEVISYERLQGFWCRGKEGDILSEGDTYPRDRHRVPAAYLEGFDMVLCADGQIGGILKYMELYVSSPRQERGYIDAHIHHAPAYCFLDKYFSKLPATGVQVFEPMHTISDANLCENFAPSWISASLKFLCDNSIPHTFDEGEYPIMLFGESAGAVPLQQLKNGAILDIVAAGLLMERGVDVGITHVDDCDSPFMEYFIRDDDFIPFQGTAVLKRVTLQKGCLVDTFFETPGGRVPGAFRYENRAGQRFLVYPFDAEKSRGVVRLYRSYSAQRQLLESIEWLCGKELPAVCTNHPDVYLLCKEDETTLAVGLWNFCEDEMVSPEIRMKGVYSLRDSYGCSAGVDEKTLKINGTIPAYGYAFFVLQK